MLALSTTTIIIIVAAVFLIAYIALSYVKAPPSQAFIISGLRKKPRYLIGKAGFRLWLLERLDKIYIGQFTVDIKTSVSVPTHDFINVKVDAVAKLQVTKHRLPKKQIVTQEDGTKKIIDLEVSQDNYDGYQLAAKNFLNMTPQQIAKEVQESLEGNMREVIGSMSLKDINLDRNAFSMAVAAAAGIDMEELGLGVISCNIQNITDDKHLIEDLGADNTWTIKKEAAVHKTEAEKAIAEAEAKRDQDANKAKAEALKKIAEQNQEVEVKKAELKITQDQKKADADAAYAIQQQIQQKTVNEKTVEAEAAKQLLTQQKLKEINEAEVDAAIAKTEKEKDLTLKKVEIRKNELQAEKNAEADAAKYETEKDAEAKLEQRKREAEATLYEAQQDAAAVKAKADADFYAKQKDAEAKKLQGDAEAYATEKNLLAEAAGIKAKLEAEAEGMEKKADAFKKYGQAALVDMIVKVLPDVAQHVAEPLTAIKDLRIYGGGASEVSNNVPAVIAQTFQTVTDATGVDMTDLLRAQTIEGKLRGDLTGVAEKPEVSQEPAEKSPKGKK